jgi:hypothetical protein
MARRRRSREPAGMPIQPNMSQRDLVKLAVLLCGDRSSAKYRPHVKGS